MLFAGYRRGKKGDRTESQSADAHASLAFCLFWSEADIPKHDSLSTRYRTRPIECSRSSLVCHYLNEIGKSAEALVEIEKARKLDPTSTPILADKALILCMNGNSAEGMSILKQLEETEPGFSSAPRYT